MKIIGLNILIPVMLLLTGPAVACVQGSSKLDTDLVSVRAKVREMLLAEGPYATEQSYRLTDDIIYRTDAEGYLKGIDGEGKWEDIDYRSQMRGAWRPSWHLYRAMLLLREFHQHKDPAYLSAVHRAMAFWIKNDFVCPNWWQNNINTPFAYTSLVIMLGGDVAKEEMEYLHGTVIKRIPVHNATGQNLIWQLDNEARIALIDGNGIAFGQIVKRMQEVIAVSPSEGIQPDYSFQQHGMMLQFGNYGMHFSNSLLFWIKVSAGTKWAFSGPKQKILFDYFSDGLRWTVFKGTMDITAVGRQLRENSGVKRGDNLRISSGMISSFDTKGGCRYFLPGEGKDGACPLVGNKGFWRSDYMVQLDDNRSMMSVKMHGPFSRRIESINTENLKGAFLNDGVTQIRGSGKEYLNIEPLWNWSMLPGTTSDSTVLATDRVSVGSFNRGLYTGQVSNGTEGASTMDYVRMGIRAKKSYFFFGKMMIALGSGIQSGNIKNVVTTVDQRLSIQGLQPDKGVLKDGSSWIYLDSTAYFFPKGETPQLTCSQRTGNWKSVDEASGDKKTTGKVLSIFLGHDTAGHYAYAVMPKASPGIARETLFNRTASILSNTAGQQSVEMDGTVMAVFHSAGEAVFFGSRFSCDIPCILILQKKGAKTILNIADLERKNAKINISFNGVNREIALPSDGMKGSTVEVRL